MLEKQSFLSKYDLSNFYNDEKVKWENLVIIYKDYEEYYLNVLQEKAKNLVNELDEKNNKFRISCNTKSIHAIYGRAKDPEHLIAKIIRKICKEDIEKYKNITVDNYKEIITDLIGIRILVLSKEEWNKADDLIRNIFKKESFIEMHVAYVCYGDRKIFDEKKIRVDYTNKGYRSQHYVVKYQGVSVEIQVRTLSEEVYGEFDHRIRYPYNISNRFLLRYTKVISKNIAQLDDLISTCLNIDNESLDKLGNQFDEDQYVNWAKENIVKENKYINGSDTENKSVKQIVQNKIFINK